MSSCRTCRHAEWGARALECAFPGLVALSSGFAAVRAENGLCTLQDRLVAASSRCLRYDPPAASACRRA